MCIAVPMRVVEIDGSNAVAEVGGVKRRARVDLLGDVSVGDYILVHAGLAISKVDADEAQKTLALLREFGDEV